MDAGAVAPAVTTAFAGVDAALATMVDKNPSVQPVETAVRMLTKVLQNIAKDNGVNPKFRRLRKTNAKIASDILSVRGSMALLCAVGFRSSADDMLVMGEESADMDRLQYAIEQLAHVVEGKKAALAAAAAVARGAALSEAKKEHAARVSRKRELMSAAEGDKEARKDPSWKAQVFEKNGKDMARLQLDKGG